MLNKREFGEFLQAVRRSSTPGCAVDERLQYRGPAGASEQVPSDGGFTVYPQFSKALLKRVYNQGEVLSRCFPLPFSSNGIAFPGIDEQSRADGSRWGGVRGYWQNEADTLTATKPRFRRSELTAKRLTVMSYMTDELYEDADALGTYASAAFAAEAIFKMEDGAINGDGAGKPLGVMAANALITVAKQGGQASATILGQNIIDMWSRSWGPGRKNSVWFVHPDAEAQLLGLTVAVGTGGSELRLYRPTEDPDNQPYNLLLGRPCIPLEQCQPLGTPGDIIQADMSQWVLGTR